MFSDFTLKFIHHFIPFLIYFFPALEFVFVFPRLTLTAPSKNYQILSNRSDSTGIYFQMKYSVKTVIFNQIFGVCVLINFKPP